MPRIHVLLKPDGTVTLEGIDFASAQCADATSALERAIGLVSDRDYKPEFYVQQDAVTQEVAQL